MFSKNKDNIKIYLHIEKQKEFFLPAELLDITS